jgi:hypothetical protein
LLDSRDEEPKANKIGGPHPATATRPHAQMAQEGAAGCGSSKLDTPAAIRHIAALLDDIAAALLKGQKKSLIALPVDVANEVHGLQRFHDGFNLIDVVADYNALRETIQELGGGMTGRENRQKDETIHDAQSRKASKHMKRMVNEREGPIVIVAK